MEHIISTMDILQQIIKEKNEIKSTSHKVYNQLIKEILTGELPKESRLNEAKITARFKTSRTPVREAFRKLEEDGLVEYIPNRGVFVKGLSENEIDDMLSIRAYLEVKAVELTISRLTEEDEENLAAIFKHMEFYTKKGDVQKMIDINYAFHRLLYQACHDRLLEKTLLTYQTYSNYCCPPNYFARGFLRRTLEEHRQIYRAIVNKDADAAVKAMSHHMEATIKRSR